MIRDINFDKRTAYTGVLWGCKMLLNCLFIISLLPPPGEDCVLLLVLLVHDSRMPVGSPRSSPR